jgi:hypothetical protein
MGSSIVGEELMSLPKYSDRDLYYYRFYNKEQWYQKQANEYYDYYKAQKSIAEHRLALLRKLGIEYDVNRDMYIRIEDGKTLWT